MKRDDFIIIIKKRSFWKIRKGDNYQLPSGDHLSDYIMNLVESQMKVDSLGIQSISNIDTSKLFRYNERFFPLVEF